jgi:hypothetical protein
LTQEKLDLGSAQEARFPAQQVLRLKYHPYGLPRFRILTELLHDLGELVSKAHAVVLNIPEPPRAVEVGCDLPHDLPVSVSAQQVESLSNSKPFIELWVEAGAEHVCRIFDDEVEAEDLSRVFSPR